MEFYQPGRANCSYVPIPMVKALSPQPQLLSFISDDHLSLIVGPIAYILCSTFFHIIDVLDLFPQYKIHPSPEELKRNRVSRIGCLLAVCRYHLMTMSLGYVLLRLMSDDNAPPPPHPKVAIAQWVNTLRWLFSYVPAALNVVGLDTVRLAGQVKTHNPFFFTLLTSRPGCPSGPSTTQAYELVLAKLAYNVLAPVTRLLVNLVVVDTYIYFGHRLCHVNRTMYRWVHAQHHQLYVPYAYGAAYASPLESLLLDTISYMFANWASGVTTREGILFTILATSKTVFDHCGYEFPWDPLVLINPNGPKYHDWHHQMPGFRYNYSSYLSIWDDIMGTRATPRQRKKAVDDGSAFAVETDNGKDVYVKEKPPQPQTQPQQQ